MTDETRKLLEAMLGYLESRKQAIKVCKDYAVLNKDYIGEQFEKGRLVEADYVICELQNDLKIPFQER